MLSTFPSLACSGTRRRETRQKPSPDRGENHQGKVLSRHRVKKDHKNKVRALLGRDNNQGKDHLVRDLDKVRVHRVKGLNQVKDLLVRDKSRVRYLNQVKHLQDKDLRVKHPSKVKGPNRIKVLLVKDPLGSPLGKVRDQQDSRQPNQALADLLNKRVVLPNKDLHNLHPKDNQALGPIMGSQQRLLVLLVNWELKNQQVDSVRCAKPPS